MPARPNPILVIRSRYKLPTRPDHPHRAFALRKRLKALRASLMEAEDSVARHQQAIADDEARLQEAAAYSPVRVVRG